MSLVGVLPKASSLHLSSDHLSLLHDRLHLLEIPSSGTSVSSLRSEHSHLTTAYPLQRYRNKEEQRAYGGVCFNAEVYK